MDKEMVMELVLKNDEPRPRGSEADILGVRAPHRRAPALHIDRQEEHVWILGPRSACMHASASKLTRFSLGMHPGKKAKIAEAVRRHESSPSALDSHVAPLIRRRRRTGRREREVAAGGRTPPPPDLVGTKETAS